jgi:hypothetical protein
MTAVMSRPGALMPLRKPQHGDLDAIAAADLGAYPPSPHMTWLDEAVYQFRHRPMLPPQPGRDCVSCPAPREKHGSFGCEETGCLIPGWRMVPVRVERRPV